MPPLCRVGALVEEFVDDDKFKLMSILLALVGLWIPAAINLSGVKNMGIVQLWTSIRRGVPAGNPGLPGQTRRNDQAAARP